MPDIKHIVQNMIHIVYSHFILPRHLNYQREYIHKQILFKKKKVNKTLEGLCNYEICKGDRTELQSLL